MDAEKEPPSKNTLYPDSASISTTRNTDSPNRENKRISYLIFPSCLSVLSGQLAITEIIREGE